MRMLRVRALVSVMLVVMLLLAANPVAAISDGELDGNGHPYVGLMVAKDADGNPLWRCSGTLLSPTVFLTAGHCTEAPAATAEIWFDADVQSGMPANGYPYTGEASGTTHTHPQYNPNAFYLYRPGRGRARHPGRTRASYGALPALNQLDCAAPSGAASRM